jgi:flagellar secretion chaperone FliS
MRNGYQNYLDQEVLTANPLRLVELLYRGALDAIGSARRYLKAGDIRARSRAVTKAMEIVTELARSLDPKASPELVTNLADLYRYTLTLLIEANQKQSDPPLAEAERLLSTLAEAWKNCADASNKPAREEAKETSDEYQPVSCAY